MHKNSTLMGLPNYFKDLHLAIGTKTGSPRIVKFKYCKNKDMCSDTYKNINKEEWEAAILNWAGHLKKGFVQILANGNFVVAGNIKDKNKIKGLSNALRRLADELENR